MSKTLYTTHKLFLQMAKQILVALDRDGTINVDQDNTGKDSDWKERLELCSGVVEGIKLLQSNPNIKLCIASNQAGVARGLFTEETLKEINKEIFNLLKQKGVIFDLKHWYMAPFVDREYAKKKGMSFDRPYVKELYDWRKPNIGMLKEAAKDFGLNLSEFKEIFAIGDKHTDVQMGLNAGGKGILINTDTNQDEQEEMKKMLKEYKERVWVARNLEEAAEIVLRAVTGGIQ